MKNLKEIVDVLKKNEDELHKKYGIRKIGVFGSMTRKEAGAGSDLDLLVEFDEGVDIGFLQFVQIENYLARLLEMKVDLVEKSVLRPHIGKHILQEVVYP